MTYHDDEEGEVVSKIIGREMERILLIMVTHKKEKKTCVISVQWSCVRY